MTDFQALINKSIKNFRLKTGLTQEKFSEKCGFNSDNYRNLEHNRHAPQAGTINKICDTFNITPGELLSFGYEKSDTKDKIINSLSGMNEKQLEILAELIKVINRYN